MLLMGDALTVLGSRIGIAWDPRERTSYLVRHGRHPGIPISIHAGISMEDNTYIFPLSKDGESFEFIDQEMTSASMSMSGVDPSTGIKVKLSVTIPFKPRDAAFSTTPAIFFDLEVKRLPTQFRWTPQANGAVRGKLFLSFSGDRFDFKKDNNDITVTYASIIPRPRPEGDGFMDIIEEELPCRDKIAILAGSYNGERIEDDFDLLPGMNGPKLAAAWCVYDEPILNVLGNFCPFKYYERFRNIDEVSVWARNNVDAVRENCKRVDSILNSHNLGEAISYLMAQSLHSWLVNTWWVKCTDGSDWFSVWEGSCYFHSTVDVEYTQGPFYLTVWPELLELELNQWPLFAKDGKTCLGDNGQDTLFLSHDMGIFGNCTQQYYPHEMEVEENANYLLLTYSHWRRTGNDSVIRKHLGLIEKLLDFILLCDTTGNGIPDKGCANTIDDASPAVQFGNEQIYLGVKALAACQAGKRILEHMGETKTDKYMEFIKKSISTLEVQGWKDDHYVVTLTRMLEGVMNPWTGMAMEGELDGWDAYHIYTCNGLVLLDMVGLDTGLSQQKLKTDMEKSTPKTLVRYGCRHSSYVDNKTSGTLKSGLAASAPKVGWISMNMLRDMAAAYRGIDLLAMSDRYWNWQCTTNAQKIGLFFETFYGNNLHFYPRGVAVFGYFDAAAGFVYDALEDIRRVSPVRGSLDIPLLLFADWDKGDVPKVLSELNDSKINYSITGNFLDKQKS